MSTFWDEVMEVNVRVENMGDVDDDGIACIVLSFWLPSKQELYKRHHLEQDEE